MRYIVRYRTGGTANYQWRSVFDTYTDQDEAQATVQELQKMGYPAFVSPVQVPPPHQFNPGGWTANARGIDENGANVVAITGAEDMTAVDRSTLVAAAPFLKLSLEAIADMRVDESTDYRELAALMMAVAKMSLQATGLRP